jgi:hypothetical protein
MRELEAMLQQQDRPAVRDFIARASARRAAWRLGGSGTPGGDGPLA